MSRRLTGRVVIATHNPGKLKEMQTLLAAYGVEAISAVDLKLAEPDETGNSFAQNARIKARAAASAATLPALADDSGLAIEVLGGEPGIHSARWAGKDKDFARAMRLVEEKLAAKSAKTPGQRRAAFVAALCLAWPDGAEECFEGRVEGMLVWPPRGKMGFGYDPMFLPNGHERTFGEMSAEEKHGLPPRGSGLSHRARAFMKLAEACLG
ncbi:MAG TPA: RdgB/HAM1 family non-canonical purine NTP pyrophosphatase [Xanthobacteraceae bacterium]|jgi:XTP/dITP diphosphohydrolase